MKHQLHFCADRRVPTVLLVLEGGQGTLKTVRETIVKKIPVVVIAGSGRAADLLDYAANSRQLYVFTVSRDLFACGQRVKMNKQEIERVFEWFLTWLLLL